MPKISVLDWEEYDDEFDGFEKIRKQPVEEEITRNYRDVKAEIKNNRRTKILLQEINDA